VGQLASVAIRVHDLTAMAAFYEGTFAARLAPTQVGPLACRFGPVGGVTLKLVPLRLFRSVVDACGGAALGVVLTGMGVDGLDGARRLVAAGGRVLAEAESSCVVYGMPRAVHEAGLAAEQQPLTRMAAAIVRHVGVRS
jgi:hypothetical protein